MVQNINWKKGRTISLNAPVHPGHVLRDLMTKKTTDYMKQVVWPATCLWWHQSVGQYQLMKTWSIVLGQTVCASNIISRQPKLKPQNQPVGSQSPKFQVMGLSPQVLDCQDFQLIRWWVKEILLLTPNGMTGKQWTEKDVEERGKGKEKLYE